MLAAASGCPRFTSSSWLQTAGRCGSTPAPAPPRAAPGSPCRRAWRHPAGGGRGGKNRRRARCAAGRGRAATPPAVCRLAGATSPGTHFLADVEEAVAAAVVDEALGGAARGGHLVGKRLGRLRQRGCRRGKWEAAQGAHGGSLTRCLPASLPHTLQPLPSRASGSLKPFISSRAPWCSCRGTLMASGCGAALISLGGGEGGGGKGRCGGEQASREGRAQLHGPAPKKSVPCSTRGGGRTLQISSPGSP